MSRLVLSLSLLVMSLAACRAPSPDEQQQAVVQSKQRAQAQATPTPAPHADANACDATQAQWIVGKTPTQTDAEQLKSDTRASSIRLLKPEQALAMDFNAARLNVELDEKGVATAVRCG